MFHILSEMGFFSREESSMELEYTRCRFLSPFRLLSKTKRKTITLMVMADLILLLLIIITDLAADDDGDDDDDDDNGDTSYNCKTNKQ